MRRFDFEIDLRHVLFVKRQPDGRPGKQLARARARGTRGSGWTLRPPTPHPGNAKPHRGPLGVL
eukprot:scaffold25348_cov61-Phaeocystis_antarctica.AAC.2